MGGMLRTGSGPPGTGLGPLGTGPNMTWMPPSSCIQEPSDNGMPVAVTSGPDMSQRRMRAFWLGSTTIGWPGGTARVTDESVGWMLCTWYNVPGEFGAGPNWRVSSVSSTHCPAWKPRLASGPSELTWTVDPETPVIAVTTEPFSRDHFHVVWVFPAEPVWISTRYSWFSTP